MLLLTCRLVTQHKMNPRIIIARISEFSLTLRMKALVTLVMVSAGAYCFQLEDCESMALCNLADAVPDHGGPKFSEMEEQDRLHVCSSLKLALDCASRFHCRRHTRLISLGERFLNVFCAKTFASAGVLVDNCVRDAHVAAFDRCAAAHLGTLWSIANGTRSLDHDAVDALNGPASDLSDLSDNPLLRGCCIDKPLFDKCYRLAVSDSCKLAEPAAVPVLRVHRLEEVCASLAARPPPLPSSSATAASSSNSGAVVAAAPVAVGAASGVRGSSRGAETSTTCRDFQHYHSAELNSFDEPAGILAADLASEAVADPAVAAAASPPAAAAASAAIEGSASVSLAPVAATDDDHAPAVAVAAAAAGGVIPAVSVSGLPPLATPASHVARTSSCSSWRAPVVAAFVTAAARLWSRFI